MSKLTDERLLPVATACMAAMVGNPGIVANSAVDGWVHYFNQEPADIAEQAVECAMCLLAAVDERREKER